jgi:hypothetical protein
MHASPLPTDSILRRHFEQLASSAGLPQPPQDSVLLRHYRQLLDARLAQHSAAERPAVKAAAQPDAAVSASKPNPAPQSAATPEAPPVLSNQPAQAEARAQVQIQATQAPPETAPQPHRSPPPAAAGGWFSRLLARIFGN